MAIGDQWSVVDLIKNGEARKPRWIGIEKNVMEQPTLKVRVICVIRVIRDSDNNEIDTDLYF